MERIKLSYQEFITYKNRTNSSIDFIENDIMYDLYLSNSGFHITTTVKKSDPAEADQIDFETNYKNLTETNSQTNTKTEVSEQVPFAKPDYRTKRNGAASWADVVAGSSISNDFYVPEELHISGGECIITNAKKGDWISAEVRDTDGVIPQIHRESLCENYPTVAQYVIRANLVPTSDSFIYILNTYPLNAKITAGLYLRITYHSSDEVGTRSFTTNYYLTKKL